MVDAAKNPRNHGIIRLLYLTGMRVSELVGLKWSDFSEVKKGAALVTVFGKGQKSPVLLVDAGTWEMVKALRGDALEDSPVFQTRTGKGLIRFHVLKIVKSAARKAGIKKTVSPHTLRHCLATHAIKDGAALHEVEQTLGHASLQTTGKYLHANPVNGPGALLSW